MNIIDILSYSDIFHEITNKLHEFHISILMSICTSLKNMYNAKILSLNNFIRYCTYNEFIHFENVLRQSKVVYLLHSYGRWDILSGSKKYFENKIDDINYDIDSYENACGMVEHNLYGDKFIDELIRKQYYIKTFECGNPYLDKIIRSESNLFSMMHKDCPSIITNYCNNIRWIRISCKNFRYCLENNIWFHNLKTTTIIVSSLADANYCIDIGYRKIFCEDVRILQYAYEKGLIGNATYTGNFDACAFDMSNSEDYSIAKEWLPDSKLVKLIVSSPTGLCDEALDYYYTEHILKCGNTNAVLMKWNTNSYIKRLIDFHEYTPILYDIFDAITNKSHNVVIYLMSIMDQNTIKSYMRYIIERTIVNDGIIVLKYIGSVYKQRICKGHYTLALKHDSFYCFVYICKKIDIQQFDMDSMKNASGDCLEYIKANKK